MVSSGSAFRFKAIQMIGTQRSGSNLLRLMLDQLPEIFGPHPPHTLVTFYPMLKYYGDLNVDENFQSLLNDVCTLVELNPVPWDDVGIDRNRVFSMCRKRTLLEIFIRINELKCIEKNKTIWCCKSLESIYHLHEYAKEGFKPFTIYLFRDGRDVAASFKKIMVGDKHIWHLANKWKNDQQLALMYISSLAPEDFISIRYEDLIANPDDYMKKLCSKIGVRYDDSVLYYYLSDESKKTAESGRMWENVTKPIIRNNTRKYVNELTAIELQIFESIAGDMLEKLGYERMFNGNALSFTAEQVKKFDDENKRLKQLAIAHADPRDLLRRKSQNEFIESLKMRFGIQPMNGMTNGSH